MAEENFDEIIIESISDFKSINPSNHKIILSGEANSKVFVIAENSAR